MLAAYPVRHKNHAHSEMGATRDRGSGGPLDEGFEQKEAKEAKIVTLLYDPLW